MAHCDDYILANFLDRFCTNLHQNIDENLFFDFFHPPLSNYVLATGRA